MERRTFLKGILGAAAAAFRPALASELLQERDEPFTVCLTDGSYILRANCMVEFPPGNAHHRLEIRCGETFLGGGEVITSTGESFMSDIVVHMSAALKKGDRLSLRYLRNGVEYSPKSQIYLRAES